MAGWPCVASRHALIVYAKITDGRSRHRVRLRERVEQITEVVAAEVADRAQQLLVVQLGDQLARSRGRRGRCPGSRSRSSPASERSSRWYSSFGISSIRRRSASPPSTLEQLAQPAPVLDRDRLPAGRLEHRRDPARRDVRHDPVQRLAVEIDDPQHLAEPRHHRVDQRLPDRALVQLRVAEQRDLAAALRHVEVAGDVAVRDRAPDRRRRPDPDRPGREVGRHRILQPARIALQPAELAQRRQIPRVELAEQILDRVQHRRSVRLDRHAIGRRADARTTARS